MGHFCPFRSWPSGVRGFGHPIVVWEIIHSFNGRVWGGNRFLGCYFRFGLIFDDGVGVVELLIERFLSHEGCKLSSQFRKAVLNF